MGDGGVVDQGVTEVGGAYGKSLQWFCKVKCVDFVNSLDYFW